MLTVLIAEWLERNAGKQGVAVSIPGRGVYFRLLLVAHSTAKTIQMKSSMTFIQSNACTEIDLIFKKNMAEIYITTRQLQIPLYISKDVAQMGKRKV